MRSAPGGRALVVEPCEVGGDGQPFEIVRLEVAGDHQRARRLAPRSLLETRCVPDPARSPRPTFFPNRPGWLGRLRRVVTSCTMVSKSGSLARIQGRGTPGLEAAGHVVTTSTTASRSSSRRARWLDAGHAVHRPRHLARRHRERRRFIATDSPRRRLTPSPRRGEPSSSVATTRRGRSGRQPAGRPLAVERLG